MPSAPNKTGKITANKTQKISVKTQVICKNGTTTYSTTTPCKSFYKVDPRFTNMVFSEFLNISNKKSRSLQFG